MLTAILDGIRKDYTKATFYTYRQIVVNKKKGGKRIISIPGLLLRKSQRSLLPFFQQLRTHSCAHGFVVGKSIITHASLHIAKESILTLDIQDFFGSITTEHLERVFCSHGIQKREDLELLVKLTTINGRLPQGAPTSPILSNAVVFAMDFELNEWATKNNLIYSRYADDMVFSSEIRTIEKKCIDEVAQITQKFGFKLNNSKTRILPRGKRQVVTGLVVNTKVNVKREYIRNTSAILHNILKDPFSALSQASRGSVYATYQRYEKEYLSRKLSLNSLHLLIWNQRKQRKLINPTKIRLHRKSHFSNYPLFRLLLLLQGVNGRISFISSVIGEDKISVQRLRNQFKEIEKELFGNNSINWSTNTTRLYNIILRECPQLRTRIKG